MLLEVSSRKAFFIVLLGVENGGGDLVFLRLANANFLIINPFKRWHFHYVAWVNFYLYTVFFSRFFC